MHLGAVLGQSAARSGQLIACLSPQFAPVMARGRSGPAYHCLAAPHSARPERASLSLPCCSTWRAARGGPAYHLRGPSGPVCYLPFMPDLRRSPLRVKSVPWEGDALLFYLEWSRSPSPRCPRPPNAHALQTMIKTEKELQRGLNLRRQCLATKTTLMLVAQTTQPVHKSWLLDEVLFLKSLYLSVHVLLA